MWSLTDRITNLPTHSITRTGVVQIPEGREIFSNMTVLENLEMGELQHKAVQEGNECQN